MEPDDVAKSNEDDKFDKSDDDDDVKQISQMPETESATQIDNVSSDTGLVYSLAFRILLPL